MEPIIVVEALWHGRAPVENGVVDFHAALMAQLEDHLNFGEPGRDDDVAADFHTGGLIAEVSVPATAAGVAPAVTQALAGNLFEARVVVASA